LLARLYRRSNRVAEMGEVPGGGYEAEAPDGNVRCFFLLELGQINQVGD
jgi:hypothetical protein